jgi:hypothetical protein
MNGFLNILNRLKCPLLDHGLVKDYKNGKSHEANLIGKYAGIVN